MIRDALDASDLSYGTSAHVERLVVRVFRVDPEWGAGWLARILEVRGSVTQTGLGDGLLPDDMVRFEPAITSLVASWTRKERAGAVIWLATSLKKRLAISPALLSGLERLARELPFVGVAVHALSLLREASRARFANLAPALLAEDPSFVLVPSVAEHLSCHRQDLLAGFLDDKPMTGRFATGRSHWVVDFRRGFATWSERDQRAHATALRNLVTEPDSDVPSLRFAIGRLADLAFADPTALLSFTSDPRQPVREIAIDAAARLDAGQGVATLISCLGDGRARWAIYALRGCFAEMPRARVLAHLRAMPTDKVTVAKEVVRLLGELGGDEAFADIRALDQPSAHRDVRIAMLRALWDHLHRPEAWETFERAARDPDWVVASRLADVPMDRLSGDAEARLGDLLARVLDRPEEELRLDLLRRAGFLPIRDTSRAFFAALARRIDAPTDLEARNATMAVLRRMSPDEVDQVASAFEPVFERRVTLRAVLEAARPWPYGPAHQDMVANALLARLAKDPLSVVLYVEFAGAVMDALRLAKLFERLDQRELLHCDAMTAAFQAIDRCVSPEALETKLLAHAATDAHDRPLLRRLALHALVAESKARGWSRDRKARLEMYRGDAALSVASAATYIFPPRPKKSKATLAT